LNIKYERSLPEPFLEDFVKCFWSIKDMTSCEQKYTILPDGYFDIIFHSTDNKPFVASIIGLSTKELDYLIPPNAICFAVSFKLLAVDYILKKNISSLVNSYELLPGDFWNMMGHDFFDFKSFVNKVTLEIRHLLNKKIDARKRLLFDLVYTSNGSATVAEISDTVHWSSRQINRFFKSRFGVSLKTYSSILRYRASFNHLKNKQLFPELNYADQAHFIREVKKYSNVTPKQLAENQNDRFIQLSTL
jgi:AraC-like DNA-binding protein